MYPTQIHPGTLIRAILLPNASTASTTAINILPGFNKTLASSTTSPHPFGLWFADANTLYVADEGDGTKTNAATDANSGLQKWSKQGSTWVLDYVLKNGLNLGTQYSVNGLASNLDPATDGLRNITGKVNGDGTVTIYAVTSTVSSLTDQGADSNKVVAISDVSNYTTLAQASSEQFTTVQNAIYGNVYRGVSLTPTSVSSVPVPAALPLFLSGLAFLSRRIRKQA